QDGRMPSGYAVAKLAMGEGLMPKAPVKSAPAGSWPSPEALAAVWKGRKERFTEAMGRSWTMSPTDYLKEPPKGQYAPRSGAIVGQLCHKVLEGWDYRAGGDLGGAVTAAAELFERLSPGEAWGEAAVEARKVLEGFLSSKTAKELGGVEILGRE